MPSDRDENQINSPEELVGIFIEESIGLYVKQKNNEHMDPEQYPNAQIQEWMVEDLSALLDGLSDQAKGMDQTQMQEIIGVLKDSLPEYVAALDEQLTAGRDENLRQNKVTEIDPMVLDKAMIEAAAKSDFAKVGHVLQGKSEKDIEHSSVWKTLSGIGQKYGLNKLEAFCEKKYEQSKQKSLKASVQQVVKKAGLEKGMVAPSSKASTATPNAKTNNNSREL